MKKVVFVDIDDTLADTGRHMLDLVNEGLEKPYRYEDLTVDFREGNQEGAAYDRALKKLMEPEVMSHVRPYSHALEALQRLHQARFSIHIVSARKDPLRRITEQWLQSHGFVDYIDHVHPRPHDQKGKQFKRQLAEELRPVALFDDTLDVVLELAPVIERVYLIDKPWNKDAALPQNVIRSKDFCTAVDAFLQ